MIDVVEMTSGAGVPTGTPANDGILYYDTTNGGGYISANGGWRSLAPTVPTSSNTVAGVNRRATVADIAAGVGNDDVTSSALAAALATPGSVLQTTLTNNVGGIGPGQTWSNVTSSRSLNVAYQNTTGRAIYVMGKNASTVSALILEVGASAASLAPLAAIGVSGITGGAIIPPGFFYRFTGPGSINTVYELR